MTTLGHPAVDDHVIGEPGKKYSQQVFFQQLISRKKLQAASPGLLWSFQVFQKTGGV